MTSPGEKPRQNTIEAAFVARDSGLLRKIAAGRKGLTDQQRNGLKLLADLLDRPAEKRRQPGVRHPPPGPRLGAPDLDERSESPEPSLEDWKRAARDFSPPPTADYPTGLVMWIVANAVMAVIAVVLLVIWLLRKF